MSDESKIFGVVVVIFISHPPFKCYFGMEFSFLTFFYVFMTGTKKEFTKKRVEIVQNIGEMRKKYSWQCGNCHGIEN